MADKVDDIEKSDFIKFLLFINPLASLFSSMNEIENSARTSLISDEGAKLLADPTHRAEMINAVHLYKKEYTIKKKRGEKESIKRIVLKEKDGKMILSKT